TDTTGQYTTIGRRWSEDFWIDYYDCHTESVDEWNEAYSLQCGSILTENGYSQYGDKWPYSDLETENQYLNDATQNALAACAKGINSNADNGGYRKSMDTCRNMGGKTHYILGREGNYLQHAAEEAALGHSRTSRNDDRIPTQHRDPFTIAIEVDSALSHCRSNCAIPLSLWGSQENYLPQSDLTGRKDQERKLRQNADALEIYSDPQMKGLIKLVTEIMIRHNIHIDDLIRHYDNSKRGSSTHWDPGQNFDWMGFKKSVCQAINDYNGQSVYDCENLIVCRECGEV
ncbi:N-acetylmuramoyl-L-alanine amidase, partial [Candidatus Woesearchaeota archaeon]|nr:N-acetylmuramoyl-L-alanine amidase [Candidatus Woesearchaeota archaeon]